MKSFNFFQPVFNPQVISNPGNNGHVTSSSRPHLARSNSSIPPVDTGSKIVEALPGGEYKVHGRLLKPNQLTIFQEAFNMFDKVSYGLTPTKVVGCDQFLMQILEF